MTESVLPELARLSVHDLLCVPEEVRSELKRRGIIRSRNVTGDIGEFIAAAMYNVKLAAPGTAGYDLTDGAGLRIQVKARAFSDKPSIRRYDGLGKGGYDTVLFLALDPITFKPFRARELTAVRVAELLVAIPDGLRYPHIEDEGVDLTDVALSAYRLL